MIMIKIHVEILNISSKKIGLKLKFNMIFHLQTNGQMERFNGIY
jgi:hypothetical protein